MKMSAEDILAGEPVAAMRLGTTVSFTTHSANVKIKFAALMRSQHNNADLWPLVARVSVRSNAPVLQCGVALVDLPGVLDSNIARASIYKDHLKRCDHVIIVAPVQRAATDDIAQSTFHLTHIRVDLRMLVELFTEVLLSRLMSECSACAERRLETNIRVVGELSTLHLYPQIRRG